MGKEEQADNMVKYQFQADDKEWDEWKNTVPRSKSLETRIIELINADTEGRVYTPEEHAEVEEMKKRLEDLDDSNEN